MQLLVKKLFRLLLTVAIAGLCAVVLPDANRAYAGKADNYPMHLTVDRSTPERCLSFFVNAMTDVEGVMERLKMQHEQEKSWWYPQPLETERKRVDFLMSEVLDSMDLSEVPQWSRQSIGAGTAFMISEVLRLSNVKGDTPLRKLKDDLWVIPGTYLQIGKIQEGMRMGDVVFTADTVANVPALYRKIVATKPKDEFNVFKFYTESPGGVLPPVWAGVFFALPGFWLVSYGTNTVWQWTLFGVCLLLVFLGPYLLRRLFREGAARVLGVAVLTMVFARLGDYVSIDLGSLSSFGATIGSVIFTIVFYLALSLAAFMASEILASNYLKIAHLSANTLDSSIIRLLCRVGGVFASLGIIIYGLNSAGFPVMGIVAGLGVGGLAFALAARPTLENLLAGVVIYMDKSIKVGDHIESSSIEGVVEDIGMRSTRIRSPDGTLISVTNSEMSDTVIRNKTRRITPRADDSIGQPPT
ncbi:MAG: mechanosensitive ion channel domain-containing protein [Burkholderiales bacterium]